MQKLYLLLVACLVNLCSWAATEGFYNVKNFGAKGDGVHIDSPAINAAIEAASEKGG